MVVWRHHGPVPPAADRDHMLTVLARVAAAELGSGRWWLDPRMRRIPGHFHAHARARAPAWLGS
jgi:hypothetical protein